MSTMYMFMAYDYGKKPKRRVDPHETYEDALKQYNEWTSSDCAYKCINRLEKGNGEETLIYTDYREGGEENASVS